MVSADPFSASSARSSLLDHCIDHDPARASVHEFLGLDKSSSSPASSSLPSLPLPVATPTPLNNKIPRSREITSRYKSSTPSQTEIFTRYRSPPPPPHLSSSSARRFASPCVERQALEAPPSTKRAVSAERRRSSPTRTNLDSRLATAHGNGSNTALPPTRRATTANAPTANFARPDHLWPTSRNLCTSMQAEPRSPAKTRHDSRGRSPSNLFSDQTLKPSPNSAQKLSDQHTKTPERKRTPLRRHSMDQSENARPSESTVFKPETVLKHRWPSSLSILKLYSPTMSKSVDLSGEREKPSGRARPVNMLHSRPTSFSSQVIPLVLPKSSGVFSHTINGGPTSSVLRTAARKLNMENKPKVDQNSPVRFRRGTSARDDTCGMSTSSSRSASSLDLVRQSEEEAELGSEDFSADDTQVGAKSTTNSTNPTRAASVPVRFLQNASTGGSSSSLDAYRSLTFTPESGYAKSAGRRQQATRERLTPTETRAGQVPASLVHHVSSAYTPAHQQPRSPVKRTPVTLSLKSWPSPTASKVSPLAPNAPFTPSRSNVHTSVLRFGPDLRKNKKGFSQVEASYLHRILHNRLLQWRFANARADFVHTSHRQSGEKLLFSVWAKTTEIRKSVTSKRIKLQQARQLRKLNMILRHQGSKLDEWTSIHQDHCNALAGAVEALDAAVLRVPVNEGIKADTQAVKEAMTSAVDVVHTVESSANRLLPKMDMTNMLMSKLAQVADQERTLLEECGDLLVYASSLEVQERSLRMQLLQFEQEKARVLGHLMAGNIDGTRSGSL